MNRTIAAAGVLMLLLPFCLGGCVSLTTRAFVPEQPGLSPPEQNRNKAGTVEVSGRTWNWFFRLSPEERKKDLDSAALAKARETFGPGAEIQTETISSLWHPLSLLLLLDILGYVEDTSLTASVWLPAAPPEEVPPPPEKPIRIRYKVEPAGDYDRSGEVTRVEYQSADEIARGLAALAEEGELSREDYREQLPLIPSGGVLFLYLGRTELENAISRWFDFTLTEGARRIFRKTGREDIPYVPGRDELWWNDLHFDLKEPWESPLEFIIMDNYLHREYRFRIIREAQDDL